MMVGVNRSSRPTCVPLVRWPFLVQLVLWVTDGEGSSQRRDDLLAVELFANELDDAALPYWNEEVQPVLHNPLAAPVHS